MTATPITTNQDRPAAFDRMLLSYLPYMNKQVKIRVPPGQREDTVQDLLACALGHWHTYRALSSDPTHGFAKWLKYQLWGVLTARKLRETAAKVPKIAPGAEVPEMATPPSQPDHVDLVRTVERVNKLSAATRDSVVMLAMGYTCSEIGERHGLTKGAVSDRAQKARRKLVG